MKTAISLPDALFRSADNLAKRLGLSRSRLYAAALADYLAKHRGRNLTARLDAIYRQQDSRLDPKVRRTQAGSLQREPW